MKVEYSKEAVKSLLKCQKDIAFKIRDAINELPQGDVKKLQGMNLPVKYRLRIGKYRIIFYYSSDDLIRIVKIEPRGDAYK